MALIAQKYYTKERRLPHHDKPMARAGKYALMVKPTRASRVALQDESLEAAQMPNAELPPIPSI